MSSPESVRLKAILFGPFFIIIGVILMPMMYSSGDGVVWQMMVAPPAAIAGGVLLLWIGIRSKPASHKETGEAAADVAKDIAKGIFEQID